MAAARRQLIAIFLVAAAIATPTAAFVVTPLAATPSKTIFSPAAHLRGTISARQSAAKESAVWNSAVGLIACVCGFVASLGASCRRASVHRGARKTARQAAATPGVRITAIEKVQSSDDVEQAISNFVPKVHALQKQAASLRSSELATVMDSLKELKKAELRGVFGEVDQLLCALIESIESLRESAITIRRKELRQEFDQLDQQSMVADSASKGSTAADDVETMMEVHVIGLSHHSAPVEVREKLAVAQDQWNRYARDLVGYSRTSNGYMVPEVAVLSTCNRFELYFASPELKKYPAIECVHSFLRHKSGLSRQELEPYLFTHSGEAATNHLFEVSSGLDSLVLGEAQILAQVKACHEHCIEKASAEDETKVGGSGGKILAKMLNAAVRTGKLVRTRTNIGKGSVSVSSAAVELMMSRSLADIHKMSGDLDVCILGAGKMGRLLLIALFTKHPEVKVTLVNRDVEKARALLDEVSNRGGSRAEVASLDQMWDVVKSSDVVFAATSCREPIINPSDLTDLDRNLMLVDISVPRNIAAECSDVQRVASYSVDDLEKVTQANAERRKAEVLKAKKLIGDEVNNFKLWQASQGAAPYLAALQVRAETIVNMEYERMSRKLKGLEKNQRAAIDKLTRRVLGALLEPIYYSMRDPEDIDSKKWKVWALRSMFRLEPFYKRRLLPQSASLEQEVTPRQLPA